MAKEPTRDITDDITGKTTAPGDSHTILDDGTSLTVREVLPPDYDALSVLPSRRAQLNNCEEGRHLCWVRNPKMYDNEDRIAENQETRPDFRVVTRKDGTPHTKQDLILCSYPEEIYEAEEKVRNDEADAYIRSIDESEATVPLGEYTREQLRKMAQTRHEQNKRDGFVGNSPTMGLNYAQALSMYTDEQIRREEDRNRRGGKSSPYTKDDWARDLESQNERNKRNSVSFGVGRGLGNENPNSALAQARNREKRESANATK